MDALCYKLPVFEGPLDLLLHLITKNKINIYDIPISELLEQYMEHINQMKELDLEIASEFLEMAARLVYIKSSLLLPKHEEVEEMKRELTGQLLELQACRQAAQRLGQLACYDYFESVPMELEPDKAYKGRHHKDELYAAFFSAAGKKRRRLPPPATAFTPLVSRKIVSVSSKIITILRRLWKGSRMSMKELFHTSKSKSEMVATFLALLELVKGKRVEMDEGNEHLKIIKGEHRKRYGNQ